MLSKKAKKLKRLKKMSRSRPVRVSVSVSSQAEIQTSRSRLGKMWEGLGLGLVSDRKPNVSVSSRLGPEGLVYNPDSMHFVFFLFFSIWLATYLYHWMLIFHFFIQKCAKIDSVWGSAPDPVGELSALPLTLDPCIKLGSRKGPTQSFGAIIQLNPLSNSWRLWVAVYILTIKK